ncbi:MAG: DUF996 domain-containing protein [Thermoproteota archaeon]
MDDLKDARVYGGIGAILSTFGIFIPYAGLLFLIVGLVLEILAVDKVSRLLNDKEIFKNYLISTIVEIVGVASATIFGIILLVFLVVEAIPAAPTHNMPRYGFWTFIGALFIVLLILCITSIISAIFLKKSFDPIGSKLNVPLFSTTALLYLIGAVLTIIIVGLLVMFVASILKVVAYFSIPETVTQTSSPSTQTT